MPEVVDIPGATAEGRGIAPPLQKSTVAVPTVGGESVPGESNHETDSIKAVLDMLPPDGRRAMVKSALSTLTQLEAASVTRSLADALPDDELGRFLAIIMAHRRGPRGK